jgi:biopolymer transport protein TolR
MAGGIHESGDPISDINVTPFVDVVLVLLVIFMVTAPALMKESIGIQLPKASTSDSKSLQSLGIAINRQGQLLLNGTPITAEDLQREAARAVKENPEAQAIISADQDARHGDVVTAIDRIKSGGLNRFALQIQRNPR